MGSEVCRLVRLYKCRKCLSVRSREDRSGLLRGNLRMSSKSGGGSRVEGSLAMLGDTGGVLNSDSDSAGVSNVSSCSVFLP